MRTDRYAGAGSATRAGRALLRMVFTVSISVLGSVGAVDAQEERLQEGPFMQSQTPGRLTATGTSFQLTDSKYLNVTLKSSEPVRVVIESIPETVTLQVESDSGASFAEFTLGGLAPLTTYHKYEDDLHNHVEITTDVNGQYVYTQDLSTPHLIFIRTAPSTIYINDSATGGGCASIGLWDAPTKTCTMTQDLFFDAIQMDSDGITLDGDGHHIGSGLLTAVYLPGRSGVTVKNIYFQYSGASIYLWQSHNNVIDNNTGAFVYGGGYSVFYIRQSNNNIISNNTILASDSGVGIRIEESNGNTLINNTVQNSTQGIGILLYHAGQTTLQNNVMSNNRYNFGIEGDTLSHFDNHSIDTSNLVNGKPIYYIRNASGQTFDASTNAGTFYCVNCNGVTIKDLTLEHNDMGLLLWNTQNSTIENVQALNDYYGIGLGGASTGNRVRESTTSYDTEGIQLVGSPGNTVIGNHLANNIEGIALGSSNNNVLKKNTLDANLRGFYIYSSQYNPIELNEVTNSTQRGLILLASHNAVTANHFGGNVQGIEIPTGGHYNTISCNTFSNNSYGMNIGYTTLYNEIFNNNFLSSTYYHVLDVNDGFPETFSFPPPIGGNYWDNYDTPAEGCTDLDSNGFCDLPRVIVSPMQDDYPWTVQNGWAACAISGSANLSITKTAAPEPVIVGDPLTYTITVTNNGPDDATDVSVTDALPATTSFVSASPSQGICSGTGTVVCDLGTLADGAGATVTITVSTTTAGGISNTATVSANEGDPDSANNTATAITTVNLQTFTLTLTTAGTGSGTVSGGGTYNFGQTATVSASANPGSTFTGWTGPNAAECATGSVLMNADKSCTANFTLNTYTLTLSTAGTGSGTVSGAGTYNYGQTATVTATANADSTFTGWTGPNAAECATGFVLMNADKSCTANFTLVSGPDLIILALSTTATAVAPGKTFSLTNTVKNQGNVSAGPFTIAFHLSTNAIYGDSDDIAFTFTRSRTSLGAGASSTATNTLTVPSSTPLGFYYVCAMADSGNTVTEGNESNNTLCTAAPIQVTLPDLVITSVTPNAGTVNQGATLSVTNTVKNQGLVSSGSSSVAFRLSPNTIYGDADDVVISTARSVSALAAGASSTATTSLTIPSTTPPNTYHVCAMADRLNAVIETDEGNNTLCSSATVTVPPPDLVMTAVSTTATAVAPGKTFSFSNTVKNQGGSKAGGFAIAFHLSSDANYGGADDIVMTATRSVTSLGVGASSTGSTTLTVPSTTPLGNYYICAMADSGNTVAEGDETNNTRCTAATVQVTRPDLVMTAVTPNATTVNRGSTLSVTNTVMNQGLVASTSFRIGFRLSVNTTYGDSDDVVITTIRSVSALAAGTSSSATSSLSIASTTPVGSYYVCAMADSLNAVVETDEGNNTFCSGATVTVQ